MGRSQRGNIVSWEFHWPFYPAEFPARLTINPIWYEMSLVWTHVFLLMRAGLLHGPNRDPHCQSEIVQIWLFGLRVGTVRCVYN